MSLSVERSARILRAQNSCWSAPMRRSVMRRSVRLLVLVGALLGLVSQPGHAQDPAKDAGLTVFAAASLKNALDDINAAYTAKTKVTVAASYAASSALAKQLEQGAPADVFASADLDW